MHGAGSNKLGNGLRNGCTNTKVTIDRSLFLTCMALQSPGTKYGCRLFNRSVPHSSAPLLYLDDIHVGLSGASSCCPFSAPPDDSRAGEHPDDEG